MSENMHVPGAGSACEPYSREWAEERIRLAQIAYLCMSGHTATEAERIVDQTNGVVAVKDAA